MSTTAETIPSVRTLLESAYRAFNARDINAALATMHADVAWPNGMEGGTVYGHEGVRAYWTRQWLIIDPRVTPMAYITGLDGRVCVQVHQVVKNMKGELLVDQTVLHVYRIEEGYIKAMEIQSSSGGTSDPV